MYSTTPLRSAPMVTKTASGEFARVARARFSSMGVELPSTTHSHVEVRVRVLSVQRREPCPSCSKQTSAHILSLCTRRKSNDITFLQAVFATRFGQSDGHSPTALSFPRACLYKICSHDPWLLMFKTYVCTRPFAMCPTKRRNDITFLLAVFDTYIGDVRMIPGCACSKHTSAHILSTCVFLSKNTTRTSTNPRKRDIRPIFRSGHRNS